MPYTLSHAAAVLPFSRPLARLRILSATVIGSMVPDFGHLMPVYPQRLMTHSALSLLTFSLPLGLFSYWFFQLLMKRPFLSLLPDQAYMRWRPFAARAAWNSPLQWLLAAAGILGGAVTHLVWDGFTHEGARGMRMMPELDDWTFELHGHHLIGARLMQDGSSLVGLAIVIVLVAYALRRRRPQAVTPRALSFVERRAWVVAFAVVTIAFTLAFDISGFSDENGWYSVTGQTNSAAIALLRGLVAAAVTIGLVLNGYLHAKGAADA
jgi:Domain of unknown function (DUF4184)